MAENGCTVNDRMPVYQARPWGFGGWVLERLKVDITYGLDIQIFIGYTYNRSLENVWTRCVYPFVWDVMNISGQTEKRIFQCLLLPGFGWSVPSYWTLGKADIRKCISKMHSDFFVLIISTKRSGSVGAVPIPLFYFPFMLYDLTVCYWLSILIETFNESNTFPILYFYFFTLWTLKSLKIRL